MLRISRKNDEVVIACNLRNINFIARLSRTSKREEKIRSHLHMSDLTLHYTALYVYRPMRGQRERIQLEVTRGDTKEICW